jgi:hypothetical protein
VKLIGKQPHWGFFLFGLFIVLAGMGLPVDAAQNPSIQTGRKVAEPVKSQPEPRQKTESTGKHAKKLEAKPVLSEEDRKQLAEMAQKLTPDARMDLNKLSEALHLEDRAIYNELRDDEEGAISDIGMLWQAAVERSGTIRYAIEKLSRRDATGKPVDSDSFTKRALQNLVHLGGVAGSMWTGTPAGLIGSGMIQDIMSGSPQDSALSKVTDADMVILAKEVEALQTEIIRLYYSYRHARERLELAEEASSAIGRYYDHADSRAEVNQTLQPLMQSLYESMRCPKRAAGV